jgi:hypothetical protein
VPAHPGNRIAVLSLIVLAAGACSRRGGVCPGDMSGTWVHPGDLSAVYVVADRGDQVEISRVGADGGTPEQRPDSLASQVRFELKQKELRGTMSATAHTLSGKKCPVETQVAITYCKGRELTVQTEAQVPVDEDCKPLKVGADGVPRGHHMREIELYRPR